MARRNPKEDSETPRTVNLVCESDMDSWSLSPALIQGKNQTQILKRVERQTLLLSITKVQSDRVSSVKNTGISMKTEHWLGNGPIVIQLLLQWTKAQLPLFI